MACMWRVPSKNQNLIYMHASCISGNLGHPIQIHKFTNYCFPSLQMFFTFNTIYVYLACPKSSFFGEYTNTHYKMISILFVYLYVSICRTNKPST